ncbi:MAG: restriction endonuclease [Opitutales bacterium]
MKNAWMVRSGGGDYIELFESGLVAIGFGTPMDLTGLGREAIRETFIENNPTIAERTANGNVGMLHRFTNELKVGDGVLTYDPSTRKYMIGEIASNYYFDASTEELPHRRKVKWLEKQVPRDNLKLATRNSLGSTLTLFRLSDEIWDDIEAVLEGKPSAATEEDPSDEEVSEESKRSLQENARERVKDKIVGLDDQEMEELLAGLLRAMGFKATVSPIGPDRGVDVMASPDGLGLQEPRIKAEVKHRKNTTIGSQDLRSFIGALRPGDRGIYLSTGGFSKDAKYEADRANIPITLLDLDGFARLIETHYDSFDPEARTLLPLIKVLWPAD